MNVVEPEAAIRATCAIGRLPVLLDRFHRRGYRLVSADLRWDGSILTGWERTAKPRLRLLGRPKVEA
jgi:hypothetical protein